MDPKLKIQIVRKLDRIKTSLLTVCAHADIQECNQIEVVDPLDQAYQLVVKASRAIEDGPPPRAPDEPDCGCFLAHGIHDRYCLFASKCGYPRCEEVCTVTSDGDPEEGSFTPYEAKYCHNHLVMLRQDQMEYEEPPEMGFRAFVKYMLLYFKR